MSLNQYTQDIILVITLLFNTDIRENTSSTIDAILKLGSKCALSFASVRTSSLSEHAVRSFRKISNGSIALHTAFVFGMFLKITSNRLIFDMIMDNTFVPVTAVNMTFALSIDANLVASNEVIQV